MSAALKLSIVPHQTGLLMSLTLCPALVFTVSQTLYESILPLVKTQVDSQIKVRDFSRAQVSIQPAEFGSWSEARNELMVEAKVSAPTTTLNRILCLHAQKLTLAHLFLFAAPVEGTDVGRGFERRQRGRGDCDPRQVRGGGGGDRARHRPQAARDAHVARGRLQLPLQVSTRRPHPLSSECATGVSTPSANKKPLSSSSI